MALVTFAADSTPSQVDLDANFAAVKRGVSLAEFSGFDPTGATASDAALSSALSAIPNGGTIRWPAGSYVITAWPSMAARKAVKFKGDGGLAISKTQTRITYSGTGSGDFITATSSEGIVFEDLMILYTSSSYTGKLINFAGTAIAPTSRIRFKDCSIGGVGPTTAACLINLDGSFNNVLQGCVLFGAVTGIRGIDVSVFSNTTRVMGCDFSGFTTWSIDCPGDGWTIDSTFEQLTSGAASAIRCTTAKPMRGGRISSWFGDATVSSNAWITLQGAKGVAITGCQFSADASTHGAAISLDACKGISIIGNQGVLLAVGISVATTCNGVTIKGNDFSTSVGTPLSGGALLIDSDVSGNTPTLEAKSLASPGYVRRSDGLLEQWGAGTTAAGGTLAVTFPLAPGSGGFSTVYALNLQAFGGGNVTSSPSAVTTSGFTANTLVSNTGAGTAANFYWRAIGV